MNRPSVRYQANPRFLGDDVRLRFGGSGDAALVYDSANDELTLQTANASGDLADRLTIQAGTDAPTVVLNESGADADFRIEGDTDPNLLFLDAGNDAVVFGGASPDGGEKVKVVGDLDFVGPQEIGSTGGNLTLNPSSDLVLNSGRNFIGDTANAKMTVGLTINQGANDDEILAFKSSDVGHAMTDEAEADTYAVFRKASGASGGFQINGWGESNWAFNIEGHATTGNSAKSSAASAPVILDGRKKGAGASAGAVAANENVVVIRTAGTGVWLADADGDTWQSGGIGMFGVTPPSQHAKINDPAGGATQDAEARTAINAVIDVLEGLGAAASS